MTTTTPNHADDVDDAVLPIGQYFTPEHTAEALRQIEAFAIRANSVATVR